eukprot:TRINITY_DN4182_c0_g1_i1.p1 TRINITY_DN4182_c0_g1~~TRINITY_DN4182_c0_g1_i1.p1  ORF type:complete len:179 (+),score=63.00 TRINITY_DN4182_c0_g1_i1:349-885(+)
MVDSILNSHDMAFNFSQPKDGNMMPMGLEGHKDMIDTGIPMESPQKQIFMCQYCGQGFRTSQQKRKHCKDAHPLDFQLKKKVPVNEPDLVGEGAYDIGGAPKPIPIDNSLRTIFGMTQIKKMPGDVRDKRLRIQTLEKRILPKLVEWWGGNQKLLISDLLQTDFLRDSLTEYLRRERY